MNISFCPYCYASIAENAVSCSQCGTVLDEHRGISGLALRTGVHLNNGRYTITGVLGQGGFGITYRCDDSANTPLAIKEFFPSGCSRHGQEVRPAASDVEAFKQARARFFEEARILARFSHPGIVKVNDVFEENNTSYMMMEYLDGQTLEQLLKGQSILPETEAISYAEHVALALEVVHGAGLLHRDIKPGNIMRCTDGRVVLIDFGTARSFETGRTQHHTIAITPGYAPLEQYARQARRGAFTDIYALAATLYHMLTGEAPVPATDRATGIDLPDIRTLNPQISRLVAWTVMEGLAMEIARRPQNARQFLSRLKGQAGFTVPEYSDPIQQFLDVIQSQPNWTPPPRAPAPPPAPPLEPLAAATPLPPPAMAPPPLPVRLVQTIKSPVGPHTLVLAPDGSWIASTCYKDILLWGAHTGNQLHRLRGHRDAINAIAVAHDGKLIASCSDDATIRLWQNITITEAGAARVRRNERSWPSQTLTGHTWKVKSVAFTGDGSRLASGSSDMSVRLWDVASRQVIRTMRTSMQRITALAMSLDGRLIASGGWEKVIHVWDTTTEKLLHVLKGHKYSQTALAFSPDGSLLVSAACDDTVYVWDTSSGKLKHSIAPGGYTSSLTFSPDGTLLGIGMTIGRNSFGLNATAGNEGQLQLWDVTTMTLRQILHRSPSVVQESVSLVEPAIAFSADSRFIAGCCGLETSKWSTSGYGIRVWSIN